MQTKVCLGFNSICQDKKHVLLLDYDVEHARLKDIENNLEYAQRRYNLSTFYIIQSTRGYNAICLTKLSRENNMYIRDKLMLLDETHNKIGFKRNGWVLRYGDDKKVISILANNNVKSNKSNAHRIILEVLYDTIVPKDASFDDFTHVLFEKYIQKREKVGL